MKTICALSAVLVLNLQALAADPAAQQSTLPPVGEKVSSSQVALPRDKHIILPFLAVLLAIGAGPVVRRAFCH